eukprot:CAMPEP_0182565812 /NCGR_PEP_ID=MMETSP1324-20130603/7443_1 /TAXON_ID=236786 /ORGANISM="Florenciella sp., Strain RCC1587" /LENGTH=322 /DNA_ID=CAMNT_0024779525 /DNA_START=104 /DNA_END=1073 /DNA_ORIENTATION=+
MAQGHHGAPGPGSILNHWRDPRRRTSVQPKDYYGGNTTSSAPAASAAPALGTAPAPAPVATKTRPPTNTPPTNSFSLTPAPPAQHRVPATGNQKDIDIDDERKLRALYDMRISQEVDGSALGEEFAGYLFRISGGNDKQGFPMKQGVLTNTRVRLLLSKGLSCYRQRKRGERKRKSVRGCIVGADLAVLNLVVTKKGDAEIEGLTDSQVPRRLGPKRASKIRKLFDLSKEDDVRKYVVCRKFEKNGKEVSKSPKIQRLVTPIMVQRKRARKAAKTTAVAKAQAELAEYKQLMAKRIAEQKEARRSAISKRRSSRKASKKAEE